MKRVYSIIAVIAITIVGQIANGKKTEPIKIDNYKVVKIGQNVQATVTISNDKESRGSYKVVARPVVVKGEKDVKLPQVVFRNTKGRILDFRRKVNYPKNTIITQKGDIVEYTYVFPYKSWMNGSDLIVGVTTKGCCRELIYPEILAAKHLSLPSDVESVNKYTLVYVEPQNATKPRNEAGSAFLEFPAGSAKLMGDFKNNAFELNKINNSINMILSDASIKTLQSIDIWGTCSPEGSYLLNQKLAQNRAIALKDYIIDNYPNVTLDYSVTSTPENWMGLVEALQNNDQMWALEVIEIANEDINDDIKDVKVNDIDNGTTYKYLLKEIYPKLRRVDYKVNYIIRDFTPVEVEQLFDTRPQDLSLREMYYLALTYSQNSPQFYDIMTTSAAFYPNDDVANINAANAALQNGNVEDAQMYLKRVKSQSKQFFNTLGVMQMVTGDYTNALENLNKAYQMNLPQANKNIQQLNNKLNNIGML